MSIELDVKRIELAEENANWNAVTAADSGITAALTTSLDELRVKHAAAAASLPKAIADHLRPSQRAMLSAAAQYGHWAH
jgi:hypothetical protein